MNKGNKEKILLKDQLFNKENVTYLAGLIKLEYSNFESDKFIKEILREFSNLELKERIFYIAKSIKKYIPFDYLKTLKILLSSLPKDQKENFIFAAYSDYVSEYGCSQVFLNKSLNALGDFTKYLSAEFAIRSFLNKFPEPSLKNLEQWSLSTNVHQRRLASEGLRPKLPWAMAINIDYKRPILILDNLFYDHSRYVTRSVANHLNDISKIDANLVISTLQNWKKSNKQNDKEMEYIISHSLRTLIKKGNKNALTFLGYNFNTNVNVKNLKIENPKIKLGEFIEFSFEIESDSKSNSKALSFENLIIDYKIIYATPYKRLSEKIFKLKKVQLKKGKVFKISKKQTFKKMTTKKLYSGVHQLQIQVNGNIKASTTFILTV